jgi:RimJ/RimL family protein N-acetyltransferase
MTLRHPSHETIDDTAVLETERLVLRPPRLADARAIALLVNDRRIAENTARIPYPYTIDDAREWIAKLAAERSADNFLFTLGGEIIGAGGAMLSNGVPGIGYWIGVPFWGNGYATEAARALVDHAFGERFHAALVTGARTSNPASRRVLEKCGFQWTGVGLYRIRAIGSSAPFDRFRLERAIWASLKSWGPTRRKGKPRR